MKWFKRVAKAVASAVVAVGSAVGSGAVHLPDWGMGILGVLGTLAGLVTQSPLPPKTKKGEGDAPP